MKRNTIPINIIQFCDFDIVHNWLGLELYFIYSRMSHCMSIILCQTKFVISKIHNSQITINIMVMIGNWSTNFYGCYELEQYETRELLHHSCYENKIAMSLKYKHFEFIICLCYSSTHSKPKKRFFFLSFNAITKKIREIFYVQTLSISSLSANFFLRFELKNTIVL